MGMASLNISLPQSLKDFVEARVEQGGYSTPSEFIRELLRESQKRQAQERLEELLLAGLDSGEPVEVTPEFWENTRQALLERRGKKPAKR